MLTGLEVRYHAPSGFHGTDTFTLEIVGEKDLPSEYQVASDGTVDFPYVHTLKVADLEAQRRALDVQVTDEVGKNLLLTARLTAIAKEAREVLGREVDLLPANEKEVFVLRDIMEQSNADVATELGLTVAAVKSRLHRARLHLRDRMNRYFRDRATKPPG